MADRHRGQRPFRAVVRPATIRPFSPEDAADCVALFESAWNLGHAYAPRRIGLEEFRAETEGEAIFVAELPAGHVAGFVSIYPSEQFIHHLYVAPDHLRRGIGRALFAAAVSALGGTASLKCQTRNPGAVAFYLRLGLIPADRGESAVGPWVRMVLPSEERAAR